MNAVLKSISLSHFHLPFSLNYVHAGFPSPADDHMESSLDLNEHVIKHPAATFFIKVAGDSMKNAGICHNDLLVVDRSLVAKNSSIVVALINQEFTVKRLIKNPHEIKLKAENPRYPDILISSECEFEIWGVVTHVIHYFTS